MIIYSSLLLTKYGGIFFHICIASNCKTHHFHMKKILTCHYSVFSAAYLNSNLSEIFQLFSKIPLKKSQHQQFLIQAGYRKVLKILSIKTMHCFILFSPHLIEISFKVNENSTAHGLDKLN